jgi:DUF4097 and DUF4098 domain-containing protein YvlB
MSARNLGAALAARRRPRRHLKSRTKIAGLWSGALWLAASAGAGASETVNQRLDADVHGTVQVTATGGQITCTGWDKPEVEITGTLSGTNQSLDVERDGDTIKIHVALKSPSVHWASDARLFIKMPASNGLHVHAVSADITVKGVSGVQALQTVSGNIDTQTASADAQRKSLSGNVKVGGDLDLDTVNGNVNVEMSAVNRARIKTISGSVNATGKLHRPAHIDLTTISGNLNLHWLGSDAANIDVESITGDISSCFDSAGIEKPSFGPGRSWHYSAANSSSEIHAKSVSGDISICNQ